MESTDAGNARPLFSDTKAAAVTCGIMNPEFRPGVGVRKAGRPESAGSTSMANAALRERADLAHCHGDHIGRESHGLGMEITAGEHLGRVR